LKEYTLGEVILFGDDRLGPLCALLEAFEEAGVLTLGGELRVALGGRLGAAAVVAPKAGRERPAEPLSGGQWVLTRNGDGGDEEERADWVVSVEAVEEVADALWGPAEPALEVREVEAPLLLELDEIADLPRLRADRNL